ncbi:MAG: aldehyde dehydrogenase [Lachnospiraceae bacterium]|nr:aldehyde dehydrogenase [Lachnospiraceae bacterium]
MQLSQVVKAQREFFNTNETKSVEFRKKQLYKLAEVIEEYKPQIYDALKKDLNKSEYEAFLTEVSIVMQEIKTAIKNIKKWSKPNLKKSSLAVKPNKSFTIYEPYGVVLVLSPWNYPFHLAIAPLVGAITAGNCVILKTSKSSAYTSKVIEEMIHTNFEHYYLYAVDSKISYDTILSEKYDYIFFTGSARAGRVVMRAASETLTPISLELGGKSPCIVEKSADIKDAAKKIVWGKTLNAGQTCVAPDFILVEDVIKEELIEAIKLEIDNNYKNALEDDNYPKIINLHHFMRLCRYIDREKDIIGGQRDENTEKIAPTIFPNTLFTSEIMRDEIFGPIIPIVVYSKIDAALEELKSRPKPLACYIFTKNQEFANKILTEFSFGGGCINDCIMHLANDHLPFGGVGESGMGNYHGYNSFKTFSHEKAILKNTGVFDIPHRFPPYTKEKFAFISKLMS